MYIGAVSFGKARTEGVCHPRLELELVVSKLMCPKKGTQPRSSNCGCGGVVALVDGVSVSRGIDIGSGGVGRRGFSESGVCAKRSGGGCTAPYNIQREIEGETYLGSKIGRPDTFSLVQGPTESVQPAERQHYRGYMNLSLIAPHAESLDQRPCAYLPCLPTHLRTLSFFSHPNHGPQQHTTGASNRAYWSYMGFRARCCQWFTLNRT
ncbi:hypothetical protein F4780DRAFT_506473 [Xylariomycetidae sp. FL0641]|nr:hypothetical protein F4780DRAFT_506473 [Xylariomycetidae sp. FL0641]